MPFKDTKAALDKHPNLKKYSAKALDGWIKSFNRAIEDHDESYAFATAYSVANKIDHKESINASVKVAGEVDEFDFGSFAEDVNSLASIPFDSLLNTSEDLSTVSKKQSDKYDTLNDLSDTDLMMKELLDKISQKTSEYHQTLLKHKDVQVMSKKFKDEIADLLESYKQYLVISLEEQSKKSDIIS